MTREQVDTVCLIAKRVARKHHYPGALTRRGDLYGAALEGGLRFARTWIDGKSTPFGAWVAWGCRCGVQDYFRKINHGRGSKQNFKFTHSVTWVDSLVKRGSLEREHHHSPQGGSFERRLVPSTNGEYSNWIGFWDRIRPMCSEREWQILWLVYYEGWSQTAVAKKMGISSARVSQLKLACLERLSRHIDIEEYL